MLVLLKMRVLGLILSSVLGNNPFSLESKPPLGVMSQLVQKQGISFVMV